MPLLKCTDTEIVYGRKVGERWAAGITGLVMLSISTGIPILLWTTRAKYVGKAPLAQMGPVGFGLFMELLGLGILFVFLMNEDVILDLTTRTYRRRAGLPLLSAWQSGPLSDLEGVALRSVSTKQGTAYRVALTWKQIGQGFLRATLRDILEAIMGLYSPLPQAEAERERNQVVQHLEQAGVSLRDQPEVSDAQIRQRGVRLTIFTSLLCLFLFAVMFGSDLLLAAQFAVQGRTVQGTITEATPSRNGYSIAFTYPANGQTLKGQDTMGHTAGQNESMGSAVDVTYLPDYPKTCRTQDSNDAIAGSIRGTVMMIVILVPVSLFYLYRFRPR